VPASGTAVGFTSKGGKHTLGLSSSGGGLFGRPMTRKSYGALLKFWGQSPIAPGKILGSYAHILVQKNPQKKPLFPRKI